jgi:DNA-binding response OmpR family regulator
MTKRDEGVRSLFLVEDDDALRRLFERALEGRFRIFSFSSGGEALNAMQVRVPDVLLSDLGLPGMPGEDLARAAALLEVAPRVVLMSADRARLAAATPLADATLPKPFTFASLWSVLDGASPS